MTTQYRGYPHYISQFFRFWLFFFFFSVLVLWFAFKCKKAVFPFSGCWETSVELGALWHSCWTSLKNQLLRSYSDKWPTLSFWDSGSKSCHVQLWNKERGQMECYSWSQACVSTVFFNSASYSLVYCVTEEQETFPPSTKRNEQQTTPIMRQQRQNRNSLQ